ncbi:hypothetical protein GQ53DRAFT_811985, partial [Thozetella sp. PMI_491]
SPSYLPHPSIQSEHPSFVEIGTFSSSSILPSVQTPLGSSFDLANSVSPSALPFGCASIVKPPFPSSLNHRFISTLTVFSCSLPSHLEPFPQVFAALAFGTRSLEDHLRGIQTVTRIAEAITKLVTVDFSRKFFTCLFKYKTKRSSSHLPPSFISHFSLPSPKH